MGNHHGRTSKGLRKNNYIAPTTSRSSGAAYNNHNNPPSSSYHSHPPSANIPSSNMGLSLPYAQLDSNLRHLAGQAEGFGRCAIGGLHGPLYHVTTLAGFTLYFFFIFMSICQIFFNYIFV